MDDVGEKLKLLHTNYVDILTVLCPENHYSPERLTAALEVFEELKEERRIGFVGASSLQLRFLAEIMRRYDCFDTVMVPYNWIREVCSGLIFFRSLWT